MQEELRVGIVLWNRGVRTYKTGPALTAVFFRPRHWYCGSLCGNGTVGPKHFGFPSLRIHCFLLLHPDPPVATRIVLLVPQWFLFCVVFFLTSWCLFGFIRGSPASYWPSSKEPEVVCCEFPYVFCVAKCTGLYTLNRRKNQGFIAVVPTGVEVRVSVPFRAISAAGEKLVVF